MSIKPFLPHFAPFFVVAALFASLAGSPALAQDAVAVQDYDLFVDPPTAFAFIKLPTGWKFVGKLDAEQLRHLPPGTLTSLLPSDEASTRFASDAPAQAAKPRS